jgi:hypothetical protein
MAVSEAARTMAADVADGRRCPVFSGSYDPADVIFLLKPYATSAFDTVGIADKEALIQSGRKHYSEMISPEAPPDPDYLALFHQALDVNIDRFARCLSRLVHAIAREAGPRPVVLASLARAGTPVGVLLRRGLAAIGHPVIHYSISIIRDRGLDERAVATILAAHPDHHLVWIDGWTGKGSIARELRRATGALNARHGWRLPAEMAVVADPAGHARLAATDEDVLIPSAILNATVSGLVSRSVLNDRLVGPDDFHACLVYREYRDIDLSVWFVDRVFARMAGGLAEAVACDWPPARRDRLRARLARYIEAMTALTGVTDTNRIKPGIGEATRAVLRRQPERLILRDERDPDVGHLVHLARRGGIAVEIRPDLPPPWRATAIIRSVGRR